jgi:molybdopterin/thiamine biosynthesis adenylyltransferase
VGAGALGNEAVKALGLLGIRHLLIVDPDCVQPSDLTRSVFFRDTDCVGRNKATVVAETAKRWFPDTNFDSLECEIADTGYALLSTADLLFSCVDSDLARLEIASIAAALGLPVCDAGLGTPNYAHGRISWFPGGKGACFGCRLTDRKRRELLTFWDATIRPCSDPDPSGPAPSTPTMAAITGSLQVELGLRWLLDKLPESTTFEVSLDGDPRSSTFRSPRSPACPFHEDRIAPRYEIPGATFDHLFQSLDESVCVVLDWPVSIRTRCLDCSHEWAPMRRAASVRRSCICPSCDSRSILELESIRIIERDSRWSRLPHSALGLPDHHRYLVRFRNGGQ